MSQRIEVIQPKAPLLRAFAIDLGEDPIKGYLRQQFGQKAADVRMKWFIDLNHQMQQFLDDVNAGVDPIKLKQAHRAQDDSYLKTRPMQFFAGSVMPALLPPYDLELSFSARDKKRFLGFLFYSADDRNEPFKSIHGGYKMYLNTPPLDYSVTKAQMRQDASEAAIWEEHTKRSSSGLFEDSRHMQALRNYWAGLEERTSGHSATLIEAEEKSRAMHHGNLADLVADMFKCARFEVGAGIERPLASLIAMAFPHAENPTPRLVAKAYGLDI